MGKSILTALLITGSAFGAAKEWRSLYEPVEGAGIPCRVMKPIHFDSSESYPVIVSLHGAGGKGTGNRKQLKVWNRQLAEKERREKFPCYVVAPQAADLWDADDLAAIKEVIAGRPSVDMNRIYILGHSMGGHGTYIFIQLDPGYFAAAAPSAGAGRKKDSRFIDAGKFKNLPVWGFNGDSDGVCPLSKHQDVFDEMKKIDGNMKLTVWAGGKHAVSDLFIPGDESGSTQLSGDRCDPEPDFMTWLFNQKRK